MAFDITTARPVKTGKFDISTARPVSSKVTAAQESKTLRDYLPTSQDIPYIASKAASGALFGIPEIVANNPISGLIGSGVRTGVGLNRFFNSEVPSLPNEPEFFPKPATTSGRVAGFAADVAGGLFNPASSAKAANEAVKDTAGGLMNYILKPSKDQFLNGKNLGREAVESGLRGTLKGMASKVEDFISKNEDTVTQFLKGRNERVNVFSVADELEALKSPYVRAGDSASVRAIDQVQDALLQEAAKGDEAGNILVSTANTLKKDFYKVIGDRGFKLREPSAGVEARKIAAGKLADAIENSVKDLPIKDVNSRLSLNYRISNALQDRLIAQEKKAPVTLVDILSFLNPKTLAANAVYRTVTSPIGATNIAQGLRGFSRTGIPGAAANLTGNVGRTTLQELLNLV